jgi:hypothetical protein
VSAPGGGARRRRAQAAEGDADGGGTHPIHAAFEGVGDCDELARAVAFACDQVVTDIVLLTEMVLPLLSTLLPLLTCGFLCCCCYCFICRSSFRRQSPPPDGTYRRLSDEP